MEPKLNKKISLVQIIKKEEDILYILLCSKKEQADKDLFEFARKRADNYFNKEKKTYSITKDKVHYQYSDNEAIYVFEYSLTVMMD